MDTFNNSTVLDSRIDVSRFLADARIEARSPDSFAIGTLHLCKNFLEKTLLSQNVTLRFKRAAFGAIDFCLNLIKPYTLLRAKDHIAPDGTSLLSHVEYMLSIIRSHGPQQLDDLNFREDLQSSQITEVNLKTNCRNIVVCLQEFEELLKRVDGNEAPNLDLNRPTPFLNTEYFSFTYENEGDRFQITRFFYPFERVWNLSEKSMETIFSDIYEKIRGTEQYSVLFEKYLENASKFFESHTNELNSENHPTKLSVMEKCNFIITYLMKFNSFFDIINFDETNEIEKKILNNMDGICNILINLPLTEVLHPKTNKSMIVYFKDIIVAADISLWENPNCPRLVTMLKNIKIVAYQLWHMCLKQVAKIERAAVCELFFEAQYKDTIEADVITEASSKHWKLKFASFINKEEILAKCPYGDCCICDVPFGDVDEKSESEDIAVLPGCPHLFCVSCLEKSFVATDSE